jgi:glycosyltransferase involved in cell wall biosynthesis
LIEDFLDSIGISLEGLRDELSGGWLFGYVDALKRAGVEAEVVCVSARVDKPVRWRHASTGAPIWLLPASTAYRSLRRRLVDPYAWSTRVAIGDVPRNELPLRLLARHLAPYCATPLLTLARQVQRENYDAILCQEYESPRFDACVGLGAVLRRPVFATFQGGNYHLTRLEDALRPLALRACSGVIIGSTSEVERVQERYGRLAPKKIARILNPFDVTSWVWRDGAKARSELGIASDALVVLWHGRVDIHRKGLDVLVDAWWRLPESYDGRRLHLILVGTGSDAEQLRQRIADASLTRVHWIDEYVLNRPRLQRYLSAADVYVFPSRHEGFPIAPIEAMACSLPIIATDVPGIRDILENGEASGGLVVPQGDAEALAVALNRVLTDDALRTHLGRLARRRAETAFSPESVGRQLRDFLIGGGAQGKPLASLSGE